jgi:hypothetical protein
MCGDRSVPFLALHYGIDGDPEGQQALRAVGRAWAMDECKALF